MSEHLVDTSGLAYSANSSRLSFLPQDLFYLTRNFKFLGQRFAESQQSINLNKIIQGCL